MPEALAEKFHQKVGIWIKRIAMEATADLSIITLITQKRGIVVQIVLAILLVISLARSWTVIFRNGSKLAKRELVCAKEL